MKELKNFGAKKVVAFATHGLFSGSAIEKIKASPVDRIITTNTIPNKGKDEAKDKILTLSVGMNSLFFIIFFEKIVEKPVFLYIFLNVFSSFARGNY